MSNIARNIVKLQANRKILVLVFSLVVLTAAIMLMIPKAKIFLIERKLNQRIETQHFSILYCTQDESNVNSIKEILENGVHKITRDLDYKLIDRVTVKIYPTLKEFHTAVGRPDAPDWFRGYADNGKLNIVSPLYMGDISLQSIVLHELTHIITRKITLDTQLWIYEGIASYEGGEMSLEYIKESISKDVSGNNIPTFEDLLSDYKTFGENNSYQFSFTAVEFIITKYGFEKFNLLLRSSCDFQKVLGITEGQLQEEWTEYLKQHYI